MSSDSKTSPFAVANVRLFVWFRLFFNARFYYPVFTVLFLDFGLSIEQFALLNAVWAAAIVLLEVPSGALADTLGRRNLLVLAGALMVVEMALLCFVPRGDPDLLFAVFLVNRILSGAAEAAASGADEALAFDSLVEAGRSGGWGLVLERQLKVQSAGYIVAMSLGAAVYDPNLVGRVLAWAGLPLTVSAATTLRLPVYLTLAMAVLTLATAVRMREVKLAEDQCSGEAGEGCGRSAARAFALTGRCALWIVKSPVVLTIILAGLVFDGCIRMAVTLVSQYYRLIHVPDAAFGLLGSAMAAIGLFVPRLARHLVEKRPPRFNLILLATLTGAGLFGMALFVPILGIIPVAMLSIAMVMLRFFQSHYLNQQTPSAQRATVLSFRGLSLNLAYGLIGILYSVLVSMLRAGTDPGLSPDQAENVAFAASIGWFPWTFAVLTVGLIVIARKKLQGSPWPRQRG
ncbi:MAG: MFS transporter [Desulfobacterales bacterium]|nr:MFS transporter [Desulfobacterales bacterium]